MTTSSIPKIEPYQLELDFEMESDVIDFYDDENWLDDWDGDALASAGFGTDEDYGYFGE